jgi:hypothetical protein
MKFLKFKAAFLSLLFAGILAPNGFAASTKILASPLLSIAPAEVEPDPIYTYSTDGAEQPLQTAPPAARMSRVMCRFSTGAEVGIKVIIEGGSGGCGVLAPGAGQNICHNSTSINMGYTTINNSTFSSCTDL